MKGIMNYKKIILYAEAFPPNRGGGENYSVDLARMLTVLGHNVEVVTPVQSEEKDNNSFKVVRIPRPITLFGFNINALDTIKHLLKNRCSIMHISGPTAIDSFLILFCKIVNIPIVITFHGQYNSRLGRLILKFTGKVFYPLADKVIVQSNRDLSFLSSIDERIKVKLMYFSGIDKEKYRCHKSSELSKHLRSKMQFKFLFIGGLSSSRPYKGVENLIKIFKKLIDHYEYFGVNLTIVGDGDLLPVLKSQARNYPNIVFKGHLEDDCLVQELCESDALILPSISDGEGFGRVALEAISCGKPVIVSKYAGIAELIQKYNAGIIFNPDDAEDSIQKIIFLINNNSSLVEYLNNAEDMIKSEGLDLVSSTKKTIEIYEEISH